jgi:hypothetical protein
MKNSNDSFGNRSRDLPVCSVVPQTLRYRVPPLTLVVTEKTGILQFLNDLSYGHQFRQICWNYPVRDLFQEQKVQITKGFALNRNVIRLFRPAKRPGYVNRPMLSRIPLPCPAIIGTCQRKTEKGQNS